MTSKIILVIEDEKPLLEAIDIKLKLNGFEVVTARTIEQAKSYIEDITHIDAIWLDHYLMGQGDGLDFVAWCKEENNAKCKDVPIFVVSNTASPDKVATYLSLDVHDYYVKANYRLDEIIANISEKISASA